MPKVSDGARRRRRTRGFLTSRIERHDELRISREPDYQYALRLARYGPWALFMEFYLRRDRPDLCDGLARGVLGSNYVTILRERLPEHRRPSRIAGGTVRKSRSSVDDRTMRDAKFTRSNTMT